MLLHWLLDLVQEFKFSRGATRGCRICTCQEFKRSERVKHDEKRPSGVPPPRTKLDANIVPTAESILVDIPGVTLPTGISCSPIQATYGKKMFMLLEEAGYEIRGQRNRIRSLAHTPTTWTLDAATIIMADSQLGSRGNNGYCDRSTVTIVCPGARAVELLKFARSARECFPGVSTVVVMAGTNDYLKKVGKVGTKSKQEASMIATQVSQDIVNALEEYRGGQYRMVFAATPKFGEKERGIFLGDFLETLEQTLNWTFRMEGHRAGYANDSPEGEIRVSGTSTGRCAFASISDPGLCGKGGPETAEARRYGTTADQQCQWRPLTAYVYGQTHESGSRRD